MSSGTDKSASGSEETKHAPARQRGRIDDEAMHQSNILFRDAGQLHVLESMCPNCHKDGETRMLMTRIPLFKDVVVSSFSCPHCGWENKDVQSSNELAPTAIRFELTLDVFNEPEIVSRDMNRQLVRSDTAKVLIPELEFEIPPGRGEINTVEGLLRNIRESLTAGQEDRKTAQPDKYAQLEAFIQRIAMMEEGKESFTLVIDDAGGNSFIENPAAPSRDPRCKVTKRPRTREETIELGFAPEDDAFPEEDGKDGGGEGAAAGAAAAAAGAEEEGEVETHEATGTIVHRKHGGAIASRGSGYKTGGSKAALNVMASTTMNKKPLDRFDAIVRTRELQTTTFRGACHQCFKPNETRMCVFDLPYFKESVIMCTDCAFCGFKDAEIIPGGGIAEQGVRIELNVTTTDDLSRDVLKSDHAAVQLPDLDVEMAHGTLGGKFSTVEGLLINIRDQLTSQQQFYVGDSEGDTERTERYANTLAKLDDMISGKASSFRFVLDDPAGMSFIEGRANGVPDSDPTQDKMMVIKHFTRTHEQEEELGIDGMKTENYHDEGPVREGSDESGSDGDSGGDSGSDSDSDSGSSSASSSAEEGEAEATAGGPREKDADAGAGAGPEGGSS